MKRPLLGLLALAACTSPLEDIDSATTDHTAGEPLVDAPSVVWANESFDEYVRFGGNGGVTYLPEDHLLVQRLQFWADALYEAARARQPDIASRVPSPRIAIQKSNVQNAWCSSIFTGWPLEAHVDGVDPATTSDSAHLATSMFGITTRIARPAREVAAGDADALFAFWNSRFDGCRFGLENGSVVYRGCRSGNDAVNAGGHFGFNAVSRWVTLTSGRIAFFHAEEENVATLAHELGHYFRAHSAIPRDQFDYFYSLDDLSPSKPTPDPRFLAETQAAREKILQPGAGFFAENELMKTQHLGFYTTEQEADELGLELLAAIGLSPDLIAQKQLHAMQNAPPPDSTGTPYAECVRLRAAGWKDEAGHPVSVPVGRPSDVHHDNCFRVFNADREQSIHHYVRMGAPPVPPGNWDEALAAIPE